MRNEERSQSEPSCSFSFVCDPQRDRWAKTHPGEPVLETPRPGWFAPRNGYTREKSKGKGMLLMRFGHLHTGRHQRWAHRGPEYKAGLGRLPGSGEQQSSPSRTAKGRPGPKRPVPLRRYLSSRWASPSPATLLHFHSQIIVL